MALTTLRRYKEYAKITTSDDDDRLTALIERTSDEIERFCDRIFGTATYRQWLAGNDSCYLRLPQSPVQSIGMVSVSTSTVARLAYSGAAQIATASCDGTTLACFTVAAGVPATTNLTLESYPTITLLIAALPSGFSGTVQSGMGSEPSRFIKPFFAEQLHDGQTFDIETPEDSVRVEMSWNEPDTIAGHAVFHSGVNTVFVMYTAGYDLPSEEAPGNLPPALIQAVHEIMRDVHSSAGADGTMQSETLGDYSYTRNSGEESTLRKIVQSYSDKLSPFRRLSI